MSARDPPNLRRWVGWGVKPESKVIEESFELAPKTVKLCRLFPDAHPQKIQVRGVRPLKKLNGNTRPTSR